MRVDGFSSQSFPIKRTPRKAAVHDDVADDVELVEEVAMAAQEPAARRRTGTLPARQQDMVFPRARDRRTASALASYLSTAGFTDWDMEVLGLDLYI